VTFFMGILGSAKMNKLIIAIAVTSLFLCTGCLAMDTESILKDSWNIPSSGTSVFDGTKNIRMERISCAHVQLELYQDSNKSKKGTVLLMAGTGSIENIGDLLLFKLDGKEYSFESGDAITEHDSDHVENDDIGYNTVPFSHKKYVVPETFIRKAATSEELLVKLDLFNNSFIEGRCSPSTLVQAKEQAGADYAKYITEESVDMGNKVAGIYGFQEFVRMMDSTAW